MRRIAGLWLRGIGQTQLDFGTVGCKIELDVRN